MGESLISQRVYYLKERGPLTSDSALFASISDRNNGERLTSRSISRIAKNRLRDIQLDNGRLSCHSCRHSAVTLALKGSATIQETQAFGRHASIDTTLIYAHNIQRLQNAPERKIDALLTG